MEALWRHAHDLGATSWSMEHSLAHMTVVAFQAHLEDDTIVEEVLHVWAFIASFVMFLSYEVGL